VAAAGRSSEMVRRHFFQHKTKGQEMNVVSFTPPLFAFIAGILILILPRLLNYVVAIYLILIGIVGLFPTFLGT
jgi:hypothetical protein